MKNLKTKALAAMLAVVLCLLLVPGGAMADGALPMPTIAGDVDGSGGVEAGDAFLLFRLIWGGEQDMPVTADANGDGIVDLWDVVSILRVSVGLDAAESGGTGTSPASGSDAENPASGSDT